MDKDCVWCLSVRRLPTTTDTITTGPDLSFPFFVVCLESTYPTRHRLNTLHYFLSHIMATNHSNSNKKKYSREDKVTSSSTTFNRRTVVSLEDFVHRRCKGDKKAIDAFKQRKEQKRVQKTQMLRQYAKAMKQEGYEPTRRKDKNPSKRTEEKIHERKDSNDGAEYDFSKQHCIPNSQEKKDNSTSALHSAIATTRETREKKRKLKLRERKERTRKLRQRTSKGQPIMKNLVHDILHKLENEQSTI